MPGTVGEHPMFPDAILPRLGERAVGDLKHAERARGRTIDLKKAPRPLPAPFGSGDRIAVALDLSQRGEKFRRNNACRMLLEKSPVTLPSGHGTLREGGTERGKDLTRLADNLIDQVQREEPRDPKNAAPDDRFCPVKLGETSQFSPAISNAAIDRSHDVDPEPSGHLGPRLHATHLNVN